MDDIISPRITCITMLTEVIFKTAKTKTAHKGIMENLFNSELKKSVCITSSSIVRDSENVLF